MDETFFTAYFQLEERHWWFEGRRKILSSLLETALAGKAGLRILDIGCGGGIQSAALSRFGTVVAFDARREALHRAAARGLSRTVQGDALTLPFREEAFHLICAFDVLEHMEDDGRALREMARPLKRGGHVLLTVPAYSFLWGRQDLINNHFRRYTLGAMKEKARAAGLSPVRGTYFNTFLFPLIAGFRLAMRPFLKRGGKDTKSDFHLFSGAFSRATLGRVFASESFFLKRFPFPFGVSLLVLCRKENQKDQ